MNQYKIEKRYKCDGGFKKFYVILKLGATEWYRVVDDEFNSKNEAEQYILKELCK